MNTLQVLSLSSSLTLALLGGLPTQAQAQSAQRVTISGSSASPGWARESGEGMPDIPFVSTRTRAEVHAEVLAARANDEYAFSGGESMPRDRFVSTHTRAEVMAEAAASRARGDFVRSGDEMVPRHLLEPAARAGLEEPVATNVVATPIAQAR